MASHSQGIDALRSLLISEFARRHGWKIRKHDNFTTGMLAERRSRRGPLEQRYVGIGWSDHDFFFRRLDGTPAAVAGHPYDADTPEQRAGYEAFAARAGLRVTFPMDFPSWWYPGRTTLVLFEPREAAGR